MKKALKGGGSGGSSMSHRNHSYFIWTYGTAAMVWIAVFVAAWVFHTIWGGNPTSTAFFGAFAAAFSVGYPAFLWKITKPRGQVLQWIATVSGAAAGLWLTIAGITGPWHHPIGDLWLGPGLGFQIFWWSRRAVMQGARDEKEAQGELPAGKVGKLVEALDGAKVLKVESKAGKPITAQIELDRGNQTLRDLQNNLPKLEGVAGLRTGAIRATGDDGDSGLAELTFVPGDPLKGTVFWRGPSDPGGTIHDPIPVGIYEDGTDASVWFTGDDVDGRALAHWLIMGVTRAGKSAALIMALADALTRRDFVCWGSDHVKGQQTFRPIREALDWCVTTKKGASKMLAAARRVVEYRANWLGERGFTQWTPDCGLPLLAVWIEEAVEIVVESTNFVRLVQQAGSTGVVMIASLQRASHTSIDTDARAQLTGAWCFGVQKAQDAHFILPDDVIEQGAHPEAWSNRKPGYSYLVAPGVPEEKWAVPLRTFRTRDSRDLNEDQIASTLREWAHVRAALDEGSAQAAGDDYLNRAAAETGAVVPAQTRKPSRYSNEDDFAMDDDDRRFGSTDDDDDYEDEETNDPLSEGPAVIPPDPDPDIVVDPNQPIPPFEGPDIPLGVSTTIPKLSQAQARAVVQQHLATLLAEGITETQPADIDNMKPETGRSREWIRLELIRLLTEAHPHEISLTQDRNPTTGVFGIVQPAVERAEYAGSGRR